MKTAFDVHNVIYKDEDEKVLRFFCNGSHCSLGNISVDLDDPDDVLGDAVWAYKRPFARLIGVIKQELGIS